MTQAHDYKAALAQVKGINNFIGTSDFTSKLFGALTFEHRGTIAHALAMMAKLQEPSEGMLETMKQIIWNNAWSRENCQINIARLLKQAEEEIK